MKKQINPSIKAHLLRSAFILLSLLAVCVIPFALGQRTKPGQRELSKSTGVVCTPGWSAGPDMPSPGVRMVGVFFPANGKFYAVGGRSADGVGNDFVHPFEYDPVANTWTTKSASFPDNQVNNMACGVLTDAGTPYIYCVGGSAGGTTAATDRVFRYNPVTDAITAVAAPWPGDADGITLPGGFTVFNNKLYILGGFQINVAMTDTIYEFTPTTNVWVLKPNTLPVQRGYIPTASIGSFIYTGGGALWDGTTLQDTTDSFKYDPVGNSIVAIASIPRATSNTRGLNFNGQMWVMGGAFNLISNEVDVYNPPTDTWSLGPPFTTARRNFPTDTNGTDHIWLSGGYDSSITPQASMEIFCNAGGPTPTPTPTPCNSGIIQNGGFETGSFPPWVILDQNATPVVTNTQAHSGTFSGFAGDAPDGFCGFPGVESLGDSSFYQQFTVPAGTSTLSFWHWDCTTDSITFDWQDAYITDSNGNILQTIFHVCDDNEFWANTVVDMTPYAGQTVRVEFLVHEDAFGDLTGMFVDDVQLLGPCGTPTPTPTATATSTPPPPTPTATPTSTPVGRSTPTPRPQPTRAPRP